MNMWMRRLAIAVVAATACVTVSNTPAYAASDGTISARDGSVEFIGAAGQSVELGVSSIDSNTVKITNDGGALDTGPGCYLYTSNPLTYACDFIGELYFHGTFSDANDQLWINLPSRVDVNMGAGHDEVGTESPSGSADIVRGGDGPDGFFMAESSDQIYGDAGTDYISYRSRTADLTIDLTLGTGGQAGETDALSQVEHVWGGDGDDHLYGDAAANFLYGLGGADYLHGGDGNDTLEGDGYNGTGDSNEQADTIYGGAGSDTASYANHDAGVNASLDGVANDGWSGENDLIGSDIENLIGSGHFDVLIGNAGPNNLQGDSQGFIINGTCPSSGAEDIILGGAGDDWLDGVCNNDGLYGQDGNDTMVGNLGGDYLSGGNGNDTVSYYEHTSGVSADLDGVEDDGSVGELDQIATDVENMTGSVYSDGLFGNSSANVLRGDPSCFLFCPGAADTILGYGGNDTIHAGSGNDFVEGGDGNDTLNGNNGDDYLNGANGTDTVNGGSGIDTCVGESKTACE